MASKIQLIERLLAKAESTTPEEAEALTAAAEKLMIKHGIDAAMIAAQKAVNSNAPREKIVVIDIRIKGSYRRGVMSMMASVVSAIPAVRMFRVRGKQPDGADLVQLVGFESDANQTKVLLESLHLQAIAAMGQWWRTCEERSYLTGQAASNARRQFIMSFGVGAGERIRNMSSEVVNSTPGSEIALRDRSVDVDSYINRTFGGIGRGRGLKGSFAGSGAGRTAGRNANTGGPTLGAASSRSLGR